MCSTLSWGHRIPWLSHFQPMFVIKADKETVISDKDCIFPHILENSHCIVTIAIEKREHGDSWEDEAIPGLGSQLHLGSFVALSHRSRTDTADATWLTIVMQWPGQEFYISFEGSPLVSVPRWSMEEIKQHWGVVPNHIAIQIWDKPFSMLMLLGYVVPLKPLKWNRNYARLLWRNVMVNI